MSLRLRVEQFSEGFQKQVHLEKVNESNLSTLNLSEQDYIKEQKELNKIPFWNDSSEVWEEYTWNKHLKEKSNNQEPDLKLNLRFLNIRKFIQRLKESIKGTCSRRIGSVEAAAKKEDETWSQGPVKWFGSIMPLEKDLPQAPPQLIINFSPNLPSAPIIAESSKPIKVRFESALQPLLIERYDLEPRLDGIKLDNAIKSQPHVEVIKSSQPSKIALVLYSTDLEPLPHSKPDDSARDSIAAQKTLFSKTTRPCVSQAQVRTHLTAKNLIYQPNLSPFSPDKRDIAPQALTINPFLASGKPKVPTQTASTSYNSIPRLFHIPKPSTEILINQKVNREICLGGEIIQVESHKKELKSSENEK